MGLMGKVESYFGPKPFYLFHVIKGFCVKGLLILKNNVNNIINN